MSQIGENSPLLPRERDELRFEKRRPKKVSFVVTGLLAVVFGLACAVVVFHSDQDDSPKPALPLLGAPGEGEDEVKSETEREDVFREDTEISWDSVSSAVDAMFVDPWRGTFDSQIQQELETASMFSGYTDPTGTSSVFSIPETYIMPGSYDRSTLSLFPSTIYAADGTEYSTQYIAGQIESMPYNFLQDAMKRQTVSVARSFTNDVMRMYGVGIWGSFTQASLLRMSINAAGLGTIAVGLDLVRVQLTGDETFMSKFASSSSKWIGNPWKYSGDPSNVYGPYADYGDFDEPDRRRRHLQHRQLSVDSSSSSSSNEDSVIDEIQPAFVEWVLTDEEKFWNGIVNLTKTTTIPRPEQMALMRYISSIMPVLDSNVFQWDDTDKYGLVLDLVGAYRDAGNLTYGIYEYLAEVVNGRVPRSVAAQSALLALFWMDKVDPTASSSSAPVPEELFTLLAVSQDIQERLYQGVWTFFQTASFALPGGVFISAGIGFLQCVFGQQASSDDILSEMFASFKALFTENNAKNFANTLRGASDYLNEVMYALKFATAEQMKIDFRDQDSTLNGFMSQIFDQIGMSSGEDSLRVTITDMTLHKDDYWELPDLYLAASALLVSYAQLYATLQGTRYLLEYGNATGAATDQTTFFYIVALIEELQSNSTDFLEYVYSTRLSKLGDVTEHEDDHKCVGGGTDPPCTLWLFENTWKFTDGSTVVVTPSDVIDTMTQDGLSQASNAKSGFDGTETFSWTATWFSTDNSAAKTTKDKANDVHDQYKPALNKTMSSFLANATKSVAAYSNIILLLSTGQMPMAPLSAPNLTSWTPATSKTSSLELAFWKNYSSVIYALANEASGVDSNLTESIIYAIPPNCTAPHVYVSAYANTSDPVVVTERKMYRKLQLSNGTWLPAYVQVGVIPKTFQGLWNDTM